MILNIFSIYPIFLVCDSGKICIDSISGYLSFKYFLIFFDNSGINSRDRLLNPAGKKKVTYIERCLGKTEGPILAASDYMRMNTDQIRPYISKNFYSLGTDGYGRSDTRKNLRKFFEVDKQHIVTYGLSVLANEQLITSKHAEDAIKKYNIDKNKPMPTKL